MKTSNADRPDRADRVRKVFIPSWREETSYIAAAVMT
jgi:hypothetical protein